MITALAWGERNSNSHSKNPANIFCRSELWAIELYRLLQPSIAAQLLAADKGMITRMIIA